jgi:hypothetical protein
MALVDVQAEKWICLQPTLLHVGIKNCRVYRLVADLRQVVSLVALARERSRRVVASYLQQE